MTVFKKVTKPLLFKYLIYVLTMLPRRYPYHTLQSYKPLEIIIQRKVYLLSQNIVAWIYILIIRKIYKFWWEYYIANGWHYLQSHNSYISSIHCIRTIHLVSHQSMKVRWMARRVPFTLLCNNYWSENSNANHVDQPENTQIVNPFVDEIIFIWLLFSDGVWTNDILLWLPQAVLVF